ncbi:glycoside hydrolase family 3 C-terminal domain-containing protein [Cellulomonas sp. zg-ZUI188]|uniref:Glycoside hydrolase family 3 C-terminal domain-containing protein n=1 Tax=Cellulomonas fengjieae TaxID=2819978 RepID=A0ABS3SDK8_9CELL|nr:glycoside hydrolase family 3 C-terminal domain-containing protein [Cellulomonas fengjieae]QVI64968.1 glycoside hydrolase family 3 C-terminal domain-containing protein [Cellulomonas fengjieae]
MRTDIRTRSLRLSIVAAVSVAAMVVPAGGAVAAPDDPDGEAAVTESLQDVKSLPSQWWWDESGPDTRRARALLRQMTLDEKVDMLHGEQNNFYGFYNGPIERLGIPALTMADGPAGVRIANPGVNDQEATQLPAPIALAATWDTALAEQYGQVAGDEAFRTGHNVLLSPAVDIARVAQAGRAFEALGEDPLLSGTIAAAEIRGIQSHPVVADIKHYNVYTQEVNRLSGGNAVVDERALQEIYTRPYAIGVEEGRPGSAMCAFNKVNGVFACESDELLNRILKEQLGFEGWVMSDYGATHSTVQAILGGLDQEMPGNTTPQTGPGTCFFCGPLLDAVRAGQVPVSRIDDAVLRILRPMFALGLFDNPPVISALPEAEHGAFARQVAERAMVLLKNEASALPLSGSVGSIAVIGADADTVVAGGGSSLVKPTYTVSPLDGIRARAGAGVLVRHVAGADPVTSASLIGGPDPIPSDYLTDGAGAPGLRAEYFSEPEFAGTVLADRTEPYAAINAGFFVFPGFNSQSPHFPTQTRDMGPSIRWTGALTAPVDGTYELAVTTIGRADVYLDDALVLSADQDGVLATVTAAVPLTAGVAHDLRVEYNNPGVTGTDAGAVFQLGWTPPDGVVAPQAQAAADLARSSQAAVVVVRDYSTEGGDKPDLDLPNGQAELIREVAAANPRTVVVLATGGAVQTSDWEGGVPAIIHSWFGGQEQGNALAGILFGDVNPSGRLPITLPVDEDSTPVSTPEQYSGIGLDQQFTEGIYVGYRGYEEFGIAPQYPFGHGLSYTTYDYRNLRTAPAANGALQVRVAVRNTGAVAGTETVQVYVGNLPTRQVQSAPKVLAGWATVTLQPGERRQVTVALSPESVSYWDVDRDRWRTPRGDIPVFVGSSSADVRLTGTVRVGGGRR